MPRSRRIMVPGGCKKPSVATEGPHAGNGLSVHAIAGTLPRPRWTRWRLVVMAVVGAALVVGAFLAWGPIGLGNGPLYAGVGDGVGWPDSGGQPVGFIIPIQNSGSTPAVVDGVDLIGGTRFPGPRVLALDVLTSGRCGGPFPARRTTRGFALSGC